MNSCLFDRINQLIVLTAAQQQALTHATIRESLPKGTSLFSPGQIFDRIYFVEQGILRLSCQMDGKDVTRWFAFPTHFATDYFSFVYQQPSETELTTVTDVELVSLSYLKLQDLCHQDGVWIDLNRRLLEEYYLLTLDRVMQFQTLSAKERYEQILAEYPQIESQVTLGHLSSFLGMSQETLSRLRQQKRQRFRRQAKSFDKNQI